MIRRLALSLFALSSAAAAEPIYLQPGQCILVGSQQVCALQTSTAAGTTIGSDVQTIYACRYAIHKDAETSDIKSYALFQIVTRGDGRKTETSLKNYGMAKADCEKEADLRSKK